MAHYHSADAMLERAREDADRRASRRDFRRYVRIARERLGTIQRGAC